MIENGKIKPSKPLQDCIFKGSGIYTEAEKMIQELFLQMKHID